MPESAYSINESPDQQDAVIEALNLVKLIGRPDETSLTQTLILKAPSRNQRYPSTVRGCFDGGSTPSSASRLESVSKGPTNRATFRASSTGRCFPQFDRKTDCYRNGVLELSGGFIFSLIRLSHINAVNPSSNIWPPFTVAVCGTRQV